MPSTDMQQKDYAPGVELWTNSSWINVLQHERTGWKIPVRKTAINVNKDVYRIEVIVRERER